MKKLYLMRHGETLFNQLGKIQGASDSPLTEVGIKQAEVAKQYFEKNKIALDAYYSSTQERASDTLEIIIGAKEYQRLKGLKEWNFGIFEGEKEYLNPKRPQGETSFGDSFVPYGGESSKEVQRRMNAALTEIMEQEENKNVLAVSHGGAMYLFIQKWLPYEEVTKIKFSNCCILEFNYDDKKFEFSQAINHEF
jgi:broad specificity phosphatase PhoE